MGLQKSKLKNGMELKMNDINVEARKKAQLLNFIQYKLNDDKEFLNKVLTELKQMSFNDLTRWAIRHDIIDA